MFLEYTLKLLDSNYESKGTIWNVIRDEQKRQGISDHTAIGILEGLDGRVADEGRALAARIRRDMTDPSKPKPTPSYSDRETDLVIYITVLENERDKLVACMKEAADQAVRSRDQSKQITEGLNKKLSVVENERDKLVARVKEAADQAVSSRAQLQNITEGLNKNLTVLENERNKLVARVKEAADQTVSSRDSCF